MGLTGAELDRVCGGDLVKLSVRDLGVAVGLRRDGATTVAATAALAAAAGVALFATGGLGGVHRGARESWDVSADLAALARTPVLTVCSGVKSILDVAATLELLETSSVPVLGFGTDAFPGFYRRDSGFPVPWRVDDVAQVAAVWRAHRDVGGGAGMVLAQPVPAADEVDAAVHDRLLAEGLALVAERGIVGKDVTPALLAHFHEASGGVSLTANLALVRANADLAAQVAVALARVSAPRVVVVGDLAVDVLVTPAVPPVAGADVPARIVTTAGGAGANTAAWLAARGVDVTLVARVGDDLAGHAALAELAASGVRPAVAVDPDAPTATVVVLVGSGGDRTMLSDRGAAARLSPADLPPLDGVDHLHLSGYVLGAASSRDAGLAAMAAARTAGASTSLDPQATGAFPTTLLPGLEGVDLLLPNAAELAAFTGSPDPRSAAALLDVAASRGRHGGTCGRHLGGPGRHVDGAGSGRGRRRCDRRGRRLRRRAARRVAVGRRPGGRAAGGLRGGCGGRQPARRTSSRLPGVTSGSRTSPSTTEPPNVGVPESITGWARVSSARRSAS